MAKTNGLPFPENLCQDIVKRTYLSRKIDPEIVMDALSQLRDDVDPKDILLLHYQEGKTLTAIGQIYGLTAERIRQKRNIGLWKLRRIMFPGAPATKGEK